MIRELHIKNFVIIDDLQISFDKGLNVLTGETGAGKSILIDALSGILGEKMTTDMIRSGFEKSTLEGVFEIEKLQQVKNILDEMGIEFEDDTLILRRELYATGRGKCFINSVQIPISRLKEISDYLVDIHGQNEHQNIAKISKHRELLDSFAGNQERVQEIKEWHDKLQRIKEKLESFDIDEREKARRIEYNNFAIREIESADLLSGEEDEHKHEANLLANVEKLSLEINKASNQMSGDDGILQKLKKAEQSLSKIVEFDTDIAGVIETVRESLYSLEDVSLFLKDYEENIDFSPDKINEVETRLALISTLKKKYGDSVDEILEYLEKAKRENEAISSTDDEMERLNEEYQNALQYVKEKALELSNIRKEAAQDLEEKVMKELTDLGMGGTIFRVSIRRELAPDGEIEADDKRYVLYPHGLDRVEFLLSANAGEELRQLRKVASGGEMSRIMLALKNVILSADIVETLIFDEVDAGISGMTAEIVGKKLKVLSKDRQVLVITHLPQIASMSDNHFYVEKTKISDRITTTIKSLSSHEKVNEIARMLAGEKITELSLKHAEEMIAIAENS